MKIIYLVTFFLISNLFANYAFSDNNTVKIDMHGGKSDMLIQKNSLSNIQGSSFGMMKDLTIKKPKSPEKPMKNNVKNLKEIKIR